jgi:methionine-rich copper-binding protein CopC
VAIAAVAIALAIGVAAPASAHDSIVGTVPASGSTVTDDPGTVSLTFSEPLLTLGGETSGFAVVVTDPAGLFHESGCMTVADTVASTKVALGAAGTYTVVWQVVSSDGHPTSGTYTFDYAPMADALVNPGMAAAPACGEPWAGAIVTAVATVPPVATSTPVPEMRTMDGDVLGTAVPIESTESASPNVGMIVAISIGGLLVLVAGLLVTLRRVRNDPFKSKAENKGENTGENTKDDASDD